MTPLARALLLGLAFELGAGLSLAPHRPSLAPLRPSLRDGRLSTAAMQSDGEEGAGGEAPAEEAALTPEQKLRAVAAAAAAEDPTDNRVEGLDYGDVSKNPLTDWNPSAKPVDKALVDRSVALRAAYFEQAAKGKPDPASAEPLNTSALGVAAVLVLAAVAASVLQPEAVGL